MKHPPTNTLTHTQALIKFITADIKDFIFHTYTYTQYHLNAVSVHFFHCANSDQTWTSLVHCFQFHLRLKVMW